MLKNYLKNINILLYSHLFYINQILITNNILHLLYNYVRLLNIN